MHSNARKADRGLSYQEAPQADGEEEAPQAPEEDAHPASSPRQVATQPTSMGRVVLVTGVCRDLGGRFARLIAADPGVDRVIGVDVVPPRHDLGDVRFVRADIRNPVIAKVIAAEEVDTVVHLSVIATPSGAGGRTSMKEINVIGTMQLLAACQKAPGVERLVVKSSARVYGSSPRDPAMFSEEMAPKRMPRSGFGKDSVEVEGYVRGFARRRPDVTVTMLRCASLLGPQDRDQPDPLLRAARDPDRGRASTAGCSSATRTTRSRRSSTPRSSGVHGTFNVAGDGVLMVSQAVRRLGKPSVAVPGFAMGALRSVFPQARRAELTSEHATFLSHGRGSRHHRDARDARASSPQYTTPETFDAFARAAATGPDQRAAGRRPRGAARGADRPGGAAWPTLTSSRSAAAARPAAARRTSPSAAARALGARRRPPSAGRRRPARSRVKKAGRRRRQRRRERRRRRGHRRDRAAAKKAASKKVAARRPPTKKARRPREPASRRCTPGRRRCRSTTERRASTPTTSPTRSPAPPARCSATSRGSASSPSCSRSCAAGITGDYEVDEFGFDHEITDRFLLTALRPLAEKWFRIDVHGIENIPADGGALVVSNHSGTVPVDGLMTGLVHPRPRRPLPAHARCRPGLHAAVRRRARPQGRRDPGQQRGRRADAVARRPGRRLAGGLQGHRQAVLRALQAAAVRPRRLRLGGAAHRRADRAVLGRRGRGDLPARRQHPVAGPAARRAVHPDHAVLPVARCARA